MMTFEDEATIRHAITKRLDKEPGVSVIEVKAKKHPDCIKVGALCIIDGTLISKTRFELPLEFEHAHLLNEIDEMAEHLKACRKDWWGRGGFAQQVIDPEKVMTGTGLRGRWPA
jgi:ribosomal protein S15P/S13E